MKKKVISLVSALVIGGGSFAAGMLCANMPVTEAKAVSNSNYYSIVNKELMALKDEPKIFEAGEHIIMLYCDYSKEFTNVSELNGFQFDIPDGYEILSIQKVDEDSRADLGGYEVILINNQTVAVNASVNSASDYIDYSQPGKVITQDNEKEYTITK